MLSRDAEPQAGYAPPFAETAIPAAVVPAPSLTVATFVWAALASTIRRTQRGEGALLAINLSLIAYQGASLPVMLAQAVVSTMAILLMYAFNDQYDVASDVNNPKKDQHLVSTYLEHHREFGIWIFALKFVTLALSMLTLGAGATAALAAVMVVNVVYSTLLKGVPVVDVAWCGLWGLLYAAIIGGPPAILIFVGLMTAVCHLYQALDDRASDAANGITTTAVRSEALSRNVLFVLSVLVFAVLRPALGAGWALTAFTPLGLFFVAGNPRTGWLLTKVYFGVVWLYLLGIASATG